MILSPEVYNKITAVVFTRQEPTVTTVFWARPSNPEGTGFDFFVFDNGSWQSLSQYDNVIIPEVDPYLSAFINDAGFYTVPTGGIPSTDLSEAVQTALTAAGTAYQKPNTGIPSTDLSSAVQTSLGKADTALQSETDPTVPSWAKASSKPSYTASEVGALPDDTPLFSGNYNDLTNKPTIPAAQVQSDWNATTGMGVILNKPTIPTVPANVSCYSNDTGEGIIPSDGIRAETVTSAATMSINPDVVTLIDGAVGTAAITLQVPNDNLAHVWDILMTTGTTPAVTFALSNSETILKPAGWTLGASKAVEISVIGKGTTYYLRYGEFT